MKLECLADCDADVSYCAYPTIAPTTTPSRRPTAGPRAARATRAPSLGGDDDDDDGDLSRAAAAVIAGAARGPRPGEAAAARARPFSRPGRALHRGLRGHRVGLRAAGAAPRRRDLRHAAHGRRARAAARARRGARAAPRGTRIFNPTSMCERFDTRSSACVSRTRREQSKKSAKTTSIRPKTREFRSSAPTSPVGFRAGAAARVVRAAAAQEPPRPVAAGGHGPAAPAVHRRAAPQARLRPRLR